MPIYTGLICAETFDDMRLSGSPCYSMLTIVAMDGWCHRQEVLTIIGPWKWRLLLVLVWVE